MQILEMVKTVTTFAVGAGSAKIIASVIANNVTPKTMIDRITMSSASVVMGMMVGDLTKTYTSNKIDEIASVISQVKSQVEENIEKNSSDISE